MNPLLNKRLCRLLYVSICVLQGVRAAPREGGRKKWTFPRQSEQYGTKRGSGGFTAAALQTSHLRGRMNPAMVQYKYKYFKLLKGINAFRKQKRHYIMTVLKMYVIIFENVYNWYFCTTWAIHI